VVKYLMQIYRKENNLMRDVLDIITDGLGRGILESGGRIGRMVSNVQVDLKDMEDHYVVEANVSEYGKDDIKVTFDKNVLVISGEKNADDEEGSGTYLIRERSHSSFKRSIRMPEEVVEDTIKASYNNGILTVTLQKVEKEPVPEAKTIKIE